MSASSNDLGEVVRELLKAGADPNIRSKVYTASIPIGTMYIAVRCIYYHRRARQHWE